jgi:hypothetical protein
MDREKIDAVLKQAETDLIALEQSGAVMPFEFRPHQAVFLLSILQLALRHPGLAGGVAEFAQTLAEDIERRIAKTDALAFVARAGWDARYDEPAAAAPAAPASTSEDVPKPRRAARGRK